MNKEKRIGNKETVDISQIPTELYKLDKIERRLNEQMRKEEFRKEFFKNPVETLKHEGIALPKDKEKSLMEFVRKSNITSDMAQGTSLIGPSKANPGMIGIAIDFAAPRPEDITDPVDISHHEEISTLK